MKNFKESGWEFRVVAILALIAGAGIFGIPNSVWWDTGSKLPRVLFWLSIADWVYTVYYAAKNMKF